MKRFRYMALNKSGQTIIEDIDAESSQDVIDRLKIEKMRILNIQTIKEKVVYKEETLYFKIIGKLSLVFARVRAKIENEYLKRKKVKDYDIYLFTQKLATLLSAGIHITTSIRTVLVSETDKKFRSVLSDIIVSIERGFTAFQAFRSHSEVFSKPYTGILEIGEATGKLPVVLSKLAFDLEKYYSFKKRIITALTYPFFVLIFVILLIIAMMVYFVPDFSKMYIQSNMKLPLITSLLITFVNCLTNPIVIMTALGFFLLIYFFIKTYLGTPVGKYNYDYMKLKLPLFGSIIASLNIYAIYINLACMLECGIKVADALKILKDVTQNEVVKESLLESFESLKMGVSLSESLKDKWFIPKYAYFMIQTGEATGGVAEMIRKSAEIMEEYVNNKLDLIINLLEPLIITILAFTVGFIMISIFLPLYNMINYFSS